jgi:ubiquinone/menaquinone biosynthesis C-methylase UbiE
MKAISKHFSTIANNYMQLRSTELAPIQFIRNELKNFPWIVGADIGCGCGRYTLKLFQYLDEKLYLYCFDNNKKMLTQLEQRLKQNSIRNFSFQQTTAERIPLSEDSLHSIFTFNAIHHFKIINFLKEAKRTLKRDGLLFIYTRTRKQNNRNIWGKYFPFFCERETRLYNINELSKIIRMVPGFLLNKIKLFKFRKKASLEKLLYLANNHHYSTFCLYHKKEFENALKLFERRIEQKFEDLNNITWYNENIMFVVRASSRLTYI